MLSLRSHGSLWTKLLSTPVQAFSGLLPPRNNSAKVKCLLVLPSITFVKIKYFNWLIRKSHITFLNYTHLPVFQWPHLSPVTTNPHPHKKRGKGKTKLILCCLYTYSLEVAQDPSGQPFKGGWDFLLCELRRAVWCPDRGNTSCPVPKEINMDPGNSPHHGHLHGLLW